MAKKWRGFNIWFPIELDNKIVAEKYNRSKFIKFTLANLFKNPENKPVTQYDKKSKISLSLSDDIRSDINLLAERFDKSAAEIIIMSVEIYFSYAKKN